jgi:hypothetical protein
MYRVLLMFLFLNGALNDIAECLCDVMFMYLILNGKL